MGSHPGRGGEPITRRCRSPRTAAAAWRLSTTIDPVNPDSSATAMVAAPMAAVAAAVTANVDGRTATGPVTARRSTIRAWPPTPCQRSAATDDDGAASAAMDRRRTDVVRGRADDLRVGSLFEDVGRPTHHPSDCERGREEL